MKKSIIILIILGILIGGAVLVDIFAKGVAERSVAASIQENLRLKEEPAVSIDGFPFIINLFKGVIPKVTFEAEGIGRGAIKFDDATLVLDNVRLDAGTLISGKAGSVYVGGGHGELVMTAETFTNALHRFGATLNVDFENGSVIVSAEDLSSSGEGKLAIEGRKLVLSSALSEGSISIPLPSIAEGLRYRSIEVGNGQAALIVRITAGDFRIHQ